MTPGLQVSPRRASSMAGRPSPLPAAVAPVLVATICARTDGTPSLLPALITLSVGMPPTLQSLL